MNQKTISVIVPVYNEAKNLTTFYHEFRKHTKAILHQFELIFVDDGSSDDSPHVIRRFMARDKNVRLVELSRNFGKEIATSAGLHRASGHAAMMIDADLQMPPKLIRDFVQKWEEGAEIVVGVFANRNMSWLRRTGAKLYYWIMDKIAHTKITPNATDFRLLDRRVVRKFCELTERDRMTRGLIEWLGFRQEYIYFEQAARQHGAPTYSIRKLIDLNHPHF